jgi:hypothetical protein
MEMLPAVRILLNASSLFMLVSFKWYEFEKSFSKESPLPLARAWAFCSVAIVIDIDGKLYFGKEGQEEQTSREIESEHRVTWGSRLIM